MKQSEKRRLRNKRRKTALKKVAKQIEQYISIGEREKAEELLPQLTKAADKAAAKGAIHRNKASRIKSRLWKKVNQL